MNKRNTLRRLLALLCCMAMLLPCVPAAVAADDVLLSEDFESYADDAAMGVNWKKGGSTQVNAPKLSTDRARSGSKSLLLTDTEKDKSIQVARGVSNSLPAGTEVIMTAYCYVEEVQTNGAATPRLNVHDGTSHFFNTVTTGQWERISGIVTLPKDGQMINALLVSDSPPVSKTYMDDVTVQVLTADLAVDYINERLAHTLFQDYASLMLALESKALGLSGIDGTNAAGYYKILKAAYDEKGGPLSRNDIVLAINNSVLEELAPALEGGVLALGSSGPVPTDVVELPEGITAQWVSVSPADKAISVSGGKATVRTVPTGADDVYSAVLRLSTASKSVDVNYTIRLVNASGFDMEVVNKAKTELAANTVIGMARTGTVAIPEVSERGVTAKWDRVRLNPSNCISVADGRLKVNAIPDGLDYYEAVAVLQLTKNNAVAELEYNIVVYNEDYRILLPGSNPGFEQLDIAGAPVDWRALGANPLSSGTATKDEARTGEYSFHFVDGDENGNYGWRSAPKASPATAGREYELSFWAKGTVEASEANRIGVGDYLEYQNASASKLAQTEGLPTATNTQDWTLVKQRGVAVNNTKYVSHMPYSFTATVADVYMDDFRAWELTTKGSELSIDELLVNGTAWDFKSFEDLIYIHLGVSSFGVTGLNPDNKAAYVTALTAKRETKGSPLTAAELGAVVRDVNSKITNEGNTALKKAAANISTLITVNRVGLIELPELNDSTITAKFTSVSGNGASNIQLTGMGARVNSLPPYGSKNQDATLVLNLSKGSASMDVAISLNLKALSKNMNDMYYAAETLDVSNYLNGQSADFVTSDLKALPTSLTGGIAIKWQALDSATLKNSEFVTAQGKVTRPAYGEPDAAVILRATLSKGSDKYERDLGLIVPALGVEEARAMYSDNVNFEAPAPSDKRADPTGWIKGIKWEDGRSSTWTTYTDIVTTAFTGEQALKITAGAKQWHNSKGALIDFEACVMNSAVTTAREGYTYTLDTMVLCEDTDITPYVALRFWGNFGEQISYVKADYHAAAGEVGTWKNLRASGVAPAGTIMVTAELNGGSKDGVTFFDDVRLREYAPVANGSFDLGTLGWTTEGTVADGKLTLTDGQTAVSAIRGANRGVTYFLSVDADGGKAAMRFVDKNGKTLAEYSNDAKNAFFAYAPANTAGVQVVLTGAMTADNVKITRSATGTGVTDGDFEISANAGVGTPWDLTNATIGANTGKTGAGLTVNAGGKALSTVFPVEDGKEYVFSVDVKGKGATLQLDVRNFHGTLGTQRKVVSESDGWTTLTISGELPVFVNATTPEGSYGQLILSGAAVFDNVKVYSVSKNVSNYSAEDTKIMPYGTFPFNWAGYGKAATYVNNQEGQYTEGVKSLAVDLFGLGEGGVRSSYLKDVKSGKAYEATAYAKGSGAKLSIEFWDKNLNKLGSESVTVNSKEWKAYSVIGTAPSGTIYATVSLGGDGVGSAQIDEANIFPVVRSVGNNIQTFIDGWFVADSSNVKRTLYEGEKYEASNLIGAYIGTPQWDSKDNIYKLWYRAGNDLYYATSPDLISWTTGYKCFNAETGAVQSVGGYVIIDEDDPVKRYKGVFWNAIQSRTEGSYDYWSSPDGINWTYEAKGPSGQDVHTLSYDPYNDEYMLTYKVSTSSPAGTETIRTHSVTTSKDLINWSEPVRQYSIGTPMDTVEENMIRTDSYGTGMYAIGDSYVGLNWRNLLYENESFGGIIDSNLIFSRDLTEDWQRLRGEDGEAFLAIPLGPHGTKDSGQIYTTADMIRVGDEIWMMYYALSRHHGYSSHPNYAGAYVGYAKWRLNGFASMDFSANGTLTTEQFTLMGNEVRLNAVGNLTVELLDAKGAVVATGKFSGDSVDSAVTWDKSIASQAGKVVSLRFTSSGAKLYTVQVCGTIFSDVAEDAWYSRAVSYAVDNGIMSGFGGGKFGPDQTLSRAMVVQMLYNKVGQPKITDKHGFNDVPADQWFNNAVTWGTKNGVMAGYGGGKFGPNDNVTIEQIAVILWNYSGNPEFDAELGNVGKYDGWAKNALTWATDRGILYGVNFKNATDNATRAQAAQMLTNYLRR